MSLGIKPFALKHLGCTTAAKISDTGVKSIPIAVVLIHVPSAASSVVVSKCSSGLDCLLFQSQITSSLQLLALLAAGEEGKAELG